ncbi:uncharacterized protein B0T23DRAFT_240888 [Neurospora hispaniola]|uniref:Transmembrane protein n=1 Tax=Neurospora hispaniola TaxID=588809 RepID=A0AAJ0MMF7_9PEZI|nr:hypothetical protein B0T23DRAFT_240888 [Neurospora hispaniola]
MVHSNPHPFTLSPPIFLFPFMYSPHFPFFCVTLPLNQPKRHRVTMKTEDRHHAMPSVHRVLNRGDCKMSLMLRKKKKTMEQRRNHVDRDTRRYLYANRNRTPSKCCRLLLLRAFPSLGRRWKSRPFPPALHCLFACLLLFRFFFPFLLSVSCPVPVYARHFANVGGRESLFSSLLECKADKKM